MYKKIIISLVSGFLLTGAIFGKDSFPFSEHAEFSLLTNTPGEELYTIFGHSAIRFSDTTKGIERVYNYGTFDFSTPNFYLKFIKGKLNYFLSVNNFQGYLSGTYPVQTVYEQKFRLSGEQKLELLKFLETNYIPENRFYLYDFFFDNCATRIRDALVTTYGEDISFDLFSSGDEKTFRELLDAYIKKYPWLDFGIDLVLAMPTDKVATPSQYMFLPDYLMEAFAMATLEDEKGEMKALVKETQVVKEGKQTGHGYSYFLTPVFLFWVLFGFIAIIFVLELRSRTIYHWFDRFFLFVTGLLGIVLLLLWFGTDHAVMKNNLNIIWALPLHAIMAFLLNKKGKFQDFIKIYFLATSILLILFFIFLPVIPQVFHAAVYPLALILLFRSSRIFWYYRKTKLV